MLRRDRAARRRSPAPARLLIRVAASGVNRPDVLQRKGLYPVPPGASDICRASKSPATIVGGDAAALAAAGLTIGDRVCALVAGGGYAELCVAPVGQCLPVPAGLSDIEAASLPETFFTVWSNVFDRGRAAGRARRCWCRAARAASASPRSSSAKAVGRDGDRDRGQRRQVRRLRRARRRPRDQLQARRTSSPRCKRLTGGKGVDVVLDMVAGDYVAPRPAVPGRRRPHRDHRGAGRHRSRQIDAGLVLRRRLTITGSTLRPRPVAFKSDDRERAAQERSGRWLEAGRVKPVIHQVFPAAQAAQAHALMESNQHIGKLVLHW